MRALSLETSEPTLKDGSNLQQLKHSLAEEENYLVSWPSRAKATLVTELACGPAWEWGEERTAWDPATGDVQGTSMTLLVNTSSALQPLPCAFDSSSSTP